MPYVVERIEQQGREVNEKRWFVPTGFQSKELIIQAGECAQNVAIHSFRARADLVDGLWMGRRTSPR